jgi:hypothetical protein
MKQIKRLFAALLLAATVAVVPAANAQTVHFAGAGSSAQWQPAALGADAIAIQEIKDQGNTGTACPYHWTANSTGSIVDTRDSRINPEPGNSWIVWIAPCSPSDGSGTPTDVWLDISVDSTVGVRTFSAQETSGSGAQVQVTSTAAQNKIKQALWADNNADAALNAAVLSTVNASGGVHVNAGLTDIRPEDALFATTRALAALNTTTWAGLGYKGVSANIGASIFTSRGTGTDATPVKFALSGGSDPITKLTVRTYTTVPIGAAPIVFLANNSTGTPFALDLATHITTTAATDKPLAHLFDGTTVCSTANPAFSGGTPPTSPANLTLFLREPLSGTMNTTEFTLFRTFHNSKDSQEVGVKNPLGPPGNPLNQNCAGGGGSRQRGIGTGEIRDAVKATAYSIGYIFFSFGNTTTYAGAANYNYLTLDGVDPIYASPTGNQLVPNCTATNCPGTGSSSFWGAGNVSYPNLRNGKYPAWSLYRWLVDGDDSDAYGPTALAQFTQNNVDASVADFVPFSTTDLSDGLEVYRSHFLQSKVSPNNGNATSANTLDGGNTLGGGPEAGGDMGGLIEGPFGTPVQFSGTVTISKVLTAGKGYKVTWKTGSKFTVGTAWESLPITVNSNSYTIAAVPLTATVLYVTSSPGTTQTGVPYSLTATSGAAVTPGVLSKKQ